MAPPAHLARTKIFVSSATNTVVHGELLDQQLTVDNKRGGARRKTAEQAERWVEKSRNRYGEAHCKAV